MMISLPYNVLSLTSNPVNFYVKPRGLFKRSLQLHPRAYQAIVQAAENLKTLSNNRYKLVVTRGYVPWRLWRQLKGKIGKLLFSILFASEHQQREEIFSANGHDDGLSVDVTLYDEQQQKFLSFLPWYNVFISGKTAQNLLILHQTPLTLLTEVMHSAGFEIHDDPREKLQVHFRLC